MNDQDSIVYFIKATGPVLPAQVAKHINSNILLASAHLAELSHQGKIKVSNLKVGGSPVYFLMEHREKLQNFMGGFNSKDQEVLSILKERKIMRERDLDLLTRVALRKTKDFSIPLNVTVNNQKELFWKWYLIDDSKAINLIKEQLAPVNHSENEKDFPVEEKAESLNDDGLKEEVDKEKKEIKTQVEEEKQDVSEDKKPGAEIKPENKIISEESPVSENKKEVEKEIVKEENNLVEDSSQLEEKKEVENKPGVDSIVEKMMEKPKTSEKKTKKPLLQKIKEKLKPKRKGVPDTFFPKIAAYFKEMNIKIELKETLRKNAEMDFVLKVPSVVGEMTYFCKAKNKKRCDEKDISAAYMEAQAKRYPLLFLYSDDLTKKAKEMLDSGTFENCMVKKLD